MSVVNGDHPICAEILDFYAVLVEDFLKVPQTRSDKIYISHPTSTTTQTLDAGAYPRVTNPITLHVVRLHSK